MRESDKPVLAKRDRTGSADTPQRRAVVLGVVALVPVAEALSPRIVVAVLRRRPVPTGGTRTGSVKPTNGGAGPVQHVQLVLGWHPPVKMAMGVKFRGVVLSLIEGAGRQRVGGRGKHGVACLGRDSGIDRAVRHYLPD